MEIKRREYGFILFPELYETKDIETMGLATEMHYKEFFFSKRLSCHLTAMLWDSCAEGQDYGLISLLVLQFCPSQFSPWFQSDPAASRSTPVGLVWQ